MQWHYRYQYMVKALAQANGSLAVIHSEEAASSKQSKVTQNFGQHLESFHLLTRSNGILAKH